MKTSIFFKPKAIKDLKKLPKKETKIILEKIEGLSKGFSNNVKKLSNFFPEYRLRVGDFRVLFEIEENKIQIYRILNRRDAYRK